MAKHEKSIQGGYAFFNAVSPFFYSFFSAAFDDFSIIDIGSGNGCCGLAWPNYAHFVDRRKPNGFERLRDFYNRADESFQYHVSDFEDFDSASIRRKAFLGIHTCGNLTDLIVERAIEERIPVAIVPCCYSLAKNSHLQARLSHGCMEDALKQASRHFAFSGKQSDYIDACRLYL
jgi:hypothetical protein